MSFKLIFHYKNFDLKQIYNNWKNSIYSKITFSANIPKSLPSTLSNLDFGVDGFIIFIVIMLVPRVMYFFKLSI